MTIEIKKSVKPIKYKSAIDILEDRLEQIKVNKNKELIWILEHEEIYTGGTSFSENEILDKSINFIKTNRGGKITYHGPGQLVFYFVIDLNKRGKNIKKIITAIERTIIDTLKNYNIECFAELYEKATSRKQSYFVGSSCKTERVGVVQDFWTDPNADYLPIFSKQNYLIIKTFEHSQVSVPLYPPSLGVQPIRQYGSIEDNFSSFKTIINQSKARTITDYGKIIDLTFEGVPLNAITEIENEKYRFLIQYPIKTINVNEEVKMVQPDTGPILFSDLNHDYEMIMENLELAFIAWNKTDYSEFLVRKEKKLNQEFSVYHYHEVKKMKVINSIII